MDESTVEKLNEVNKIFYRDVGTYFDSSRNYSWDGWERLWQDSLKDHEFEQVLDLGCGNGRLLQFLIERDWDGEYIGIDNNDYLLGQGEKRYRSSKFKFIKSDLLQLNFNELGKFNLINCFGVMHHIPGSDNRVKLIKNSLNSLSEGGILALTFWQFLNEKRYRDRLINHHEVGFKTEQLEEDDYFLDWQKGKKAIRYCHYVGDKEFTSYMQLGNKLNKHHFYADGKNGSLNRYLVYAKESQLTYRTNEA